MLSMEERIKRADERVARQERQKRVELRQEREAKKKAEQRRNYAVGELISKYFPQISEPELLENFLLLLVSDQDLLEQLAALAAKSAGAKAGKIPFRCSDV